MGLEVFDKGQGGDGDAFAVDVGHVGGGGLVQGQQGLTDTLGAESGGELGRNVVGIVVVHRFVVGGDDVTLGRVDGAGHFLEGDIALPFVVIGPAGDGQAGVLPGADGNFAPAQVADVAVDVGEEEVVGGVHPAAHGVGQLVAVLRPQHGGDDIGPGLGAVGGGVFKGQAVLSGGAAGDDGAVASSPGGDLMVVAAPDLDGLLPGVGGTPVAGVEVGPAGISILVDVGHAVHPGTGSVKFLDIQVLVVPAEVGDAPGHLVVVAEVGEAGHAGDGQADDVPFGAGDVALVVDVGGVQGAVGIAGQQGLAGGGVVAGQGPAIAAAVRLVEQVDGCGAGNQFRQVVVQFALVAAARGQDLKLAGLIARGQQGRLFRPQFPHQLGAPGLGFEDAHKDVAHLEDHQAVPGLPGLGVYAGNGVFDGEITLGGGGFNPGVDAGGVGVHQLAGVGVDRAVVRLGAVHQAEAAHHYVLVQGGLPNDLGPAAAAPSPVVFHLPEAVLGGEEALDEEGVGLIGGAGVGNAPGVAVDFGRGGKARQGNPAGGAGQVGGEIGLGKHGRSGYCR